MGFIQDRRLWIICISILGLAVAQFTLTVFLDESDLTTDVSRQICAIDINNNNNHEMKRALTRVKGKECRSMIEDAACKTKSFLLHDFPESTCINHNSSLFNKFFGCFNNSVEIQVLNDAHFKKIDEQRCQAECYRAGFLYFAWNNEDCLCGSSTETQQIENVMKCNHYDCLEEARNQCVLEGGISVFTTGITRNVVWPPTSYVDVESVPEGAKPVKILFLLQFNGRNDRQVKRLLKAIYSPKHLYIIHVDKRQKYMMKEMEKLESLLHNIYIIPDGFSTIWGGSSLLTMYQEVIRQSLRLPNFSTWDYLINLSESDFPILSLEELEAQLQRNFGKSFLASHGYNTAKFIEKQGIDHYFVECEERMWRVGKRDQFPKNIRIDGGSDWLILHRNFAEYSISNETLPSKLRELFSTVLLPLESYYHTLAQNSHFCDSIFNGNLKFTNWLRKQGCRCESIKKVVDWCGCSPLVIKAQDFGKFTTESAIKKSQYFARKFESLVDINAIAYAEAQVFRFRPKAINSMHPSFNSTFVNFFASDVDEFDHSLTMLATSVAQTAFPTCKLEKLNRIDIFRLNSASSHRIVFSIITDMGPAEILVSRMQRLIIFPNPTVDGFKLYNITFGVNIDHKEEIFRSPTSFIDVNGTATVSVRWSSLKKLNPYEDKTSPSVNFAWYNGRGEMVATQDVKPYDSIYGTQFSSLNLSSLDDDKKVAGTWRVLVHKEAHMLAELYFPVFDIPKSVSSPVFDEFSRLVQLYFFVLDSCTNSCSDTVWSTSYPDPKSDILRGYDPVLNIIA